MKIKTSKHLTSIILITAIFSLFSIISSGTPYAAMPDFQWQDSIAVDAPTAVDVDRSGTIYVAESSNNRLLIINKGGIAGTLSGLEKPTSVAVYEGKARGKKIFIGNRDKGNVMVYDGSLRFLYKLGSGDGEFTYPNAIATDGNGNAYVTDGKENTVKVYSPDGSYKNSIGAPGSSDGQFNFPVAIAIDEGAGEIVVSDLPVANGMFGLNEEARIQVFDMGGSFQRSFGDYGVAEGKLTKPFGVEVDSEGRIYVSDARTHSVQVFDSQGSHLGTVQSSDSPMRTPLGISLKNNNLYIASLVTASVEVYHLGAGAPDISVTPASHDFGEVGTGSSSAATITVGNDGTAALVIDSVSSPSEPFSITADSCSGESLAPAATCEIEVTFSPADAVTYAGNFTIQSNDPDEGSVSVSLTGTGIADSTAPIADFTASTTSGAAPLSVDFINNSTGVNTPLSFAWDFNNDGIIDSADESPSVLYSEEGTYSVSLTVTDALGATSTLTRTDYITVSSDLYTVRASVVGKGSVSSSPSGISCPGDCSEGYASGAGVVLTAAAEDNWRFSGWSGACSGTGSCTVTMDSDIEVTATFECTLSFTDLPGWAEDYILAVACEGIMSGYDDGTFGPNDNVTRADMAEFIISGLYGDSFIYSSTPYFSDVLADHASFKYIQKMYEDGITTGCGGGSYCADGTVTRAQMAVFIIRALYGEGFEYTETPYFADVSSDHWAFGHIQRMKDDGITGGCSETAYCSAINVTRAQMAVFLGRAFLGQ